MFSWSLFEICFLEKKLENLAPCPPLQEKVMIACWAIT